MDSELLDSCSQIFAKSVADCLRDMLGAEIVVDPRLETRSFLPSHPLTVMIHFTGPVQGEYAVSLEESTAAFLIGAWSEGVSREQLKSLRNDFGGMLKEMLNAAVGQAIPHLEARVDRLTYHPPLIIFGELEYPDVPSGLVRLSTGSGEIECSFVLDMAGTEAERMLTRAMDDLRHAREKVQSCYRVLHDLVEKPPEGRALNHIIEEAKLLLDDESSFISNDPTTQGRW